MPQQLPTGGILLDAFPFDSNPNTITTVNGYARGDRSVDAWTMRSAFKQFFSDGVFGKPANAFQINKASSGLAVTIEPGQCIIRGGMGGIKDDEGPLTLTLDTSGAAAGNVCYGIMLRYDDNSDVRGIEIYAKKGTAGASPTPPEPDQTSANVFELRLGYVTVPNGATDLSNASVTNEKGLESCPYAAPFANIDLSDVVHDAQAQGDYAVQQLLDVLDQYRDVIDAAMDGTAATYLQQQITELREQLESNALDLTDEVDNTTIVYDNDGDVRNPTLLRINKLGISKDYLTIALQTELGILDTSGWNFDTYYSTAQGLSGEPQDQYIDNIPDGAVNTWTAAQLRKMVDLVSSTADSTLMNKLSSSTVQNWSATDCKQLLGIGQAAEAIFIGKIPQTNVNSWGFDNTYENLVATDTANRAALTAKIQKTTVAGWTGAQCSQIAQVADDAFKSTLAKAYPMDSATWAQLDAFMDLLNATQRKQMVGKEKAADGKTYIIVGTDKDPLADGSGNAHATFMCKSFYSTAKLSDYNGGVNLYQYAENSMYPALSADIRAVAKLVTKKFIENKSTKNHQVHCFEPAVKEVGCTTYNTGSPSHPVQSNIPTSVNDGTTYSWFSGSSSASRRSIYGAEWYTRSSYNNRTYAPFYIIASGGCDTAPYDSGTARGRIAMFCI